MQRVRLQQLARPVAYFLSSTKDNLIHPVFSNPVRAIGVEPLSMSIVMANGGSVVRQLRLLILLFLMYHVISCYIYIYHLSCLSVSKEVFVTL